MRPQMNEGPGVTETDDSRHIDLRTRLLEAAQDVFADSGYASATVDDIISAASTSRATFYRYFRSKEDLFDELSRGAFHEMRALTKALAAFDPKVAGREGLEQLVVSFTDMQRRRRGIVRAWMEQVDRPESAVRREAANTFHSLLRGIEDRIQSVAISSGVDSEVQAALLLILLNRSTFYVLHRHSRIDPENLAPTLATMIHRAYFGASAERRSRLRVAAVAD